MHDISTQTFLASIFPCKVCGKSHEKTAANSNQIEAISSVELQKEPKPLTPFNYNKTINNNNTNSSNDASNSNDDSHQKKPQKSNQFHRMLDEIRAIFDTQGNSVDIDHVMQVLTKYESSRDDWEKYAFYEPNKYKRNLVDEHEKYNIMVLSWGVGAKSSIHDHSGSHCFMKVSALHVNKCFF